MTTFRAPALLPINLIRNSRIYVPGGETTVENLRDGAAAPRWIDSSNSGTRTLFGMFGRRVQVSAWALAGHNLAGVTCQFSTYTAATGWVLQDTFVPGSTSDPVVRLFTSAIAVGVRLEMVSPASAPQIGEWYVADAFIFPSMPSISGREQSELARLIQTGTPAGASYRVALANTKWTVKYVLRELQWAQREILSQAYRDSGGGGHHVMILDEETQSRFVQWATANLAQDASGPTLRYAASLAFVEVR